MDYVQNICLHLFPLLLEINTAYNLRNVSVYKLHALRLIYTTTHFYHQSCVIGIYCLKIPKIQQVFALLIAYSPLAWLVLLCFISTANALAKYTMQDWEQIAAL